MQTAAWVKAGRILDNCQRGLIAAAAIGLVWGSTTTSAQAADPAKRRPAKPRSQVAKKLVVPDELFSETEPPLALQSAVPAGGQAAANPAGSVRRAAAEETRSSVATPVSHESTAAPRKFQATAERPISAVPTVTESAPATEESPRWVLRTVRYRGGATVEEEVLPPRQPLGRVMIPTSMTQLPPPAPPEEGSVPATPSATPPANTGATPPAATVAEAEKLGDAAESNNLQFLRTQAVLLEPGQWQFDWGLTYSVLDNHFPTAIVDGGGDVVGVTDTRVRQRQLIVPLALRYGWSESIQLFTNLPVGWANTEVSLGGIDEDSNVGGLGDIEAGASVLLKSATEPYGADIIATLSFSAPTGDATLPASALDPADTMGEGYWSLSQSFLFVHTIDPVVVFYGVGYRHRFDNDFGDDIHADPGEEFNYQLGTGFAVNPWITLSGSVLGAYLTNLEINGHDIEGTDRDPIRLRLSLTAAKGCCIIEPFAEVGMTEDAASRVGVVFTY
ncbi:MAG: transporter [Planctomycetaceae bacterium]